MHDEDGAFTIAAFCAWAQVGRTFAYALISRGELTAIKAGNKTLIKKSEARAWLASLPPITRQTCREAS
jgi:excisionase family DNA binding protein